MDLMKRLLYIILCLSIIMVSGCETPTKIGHEKREKRDGNDEKKPTDPVKEHEAVLEVLSVDIRTGVNMYMGPDPAAEVIAVLPYGNRLNIIARNKRISVVRGRAGKWLRVRSGDRAGWIFERDLLPHSDIVKKGGADAKDPGSSKSVKEPGDKRESGKGDPYVPDPDRIDPNKEEPIQPPRLKWKERFRIMKFDSRLIVQEEDRTHVIGRLVKKQNETNWRIETIRRTCGGGRGDESPTLGADDLRFRVNYRWCTVDPGDLVELRCINCDILQYECRLTEETVLATVAEAQIFKAPIECVLIHNSFCEKECSE